MGFPGGNKSKENSDLILNRAITEYLSGYKALPECQCTVLGNTRTNTGFNASSSAVYQSSTL